MAKIGYMIREARAERKNWYQWELAKKIGTSVTQISRWENDHDQPDEHWLALLEEALDCSLRDVAEEIRDCLGNLPVTVRHISEESGLSLPTIYNLKDGKIASPRKLTADRILQALATLRERHAGDFAEQDISNDGEGVAEDEPERLGFLLNRGLGKDELTGKFIKRYRLFDPHNEEHVSSLPHTPGVYLLYAGNNDVAIPSEAILSGEMGAGVKSKMRIVGTPEYIGYASDIHQRIRQWQSDYRTGTPTDKTGRPRAWWFHEGWINFAVYVETDIVLERELETLLIKLLSPQINKNTHGV